MTIGGAITAIRTMIAGENAAAGIVTGVRKTEGGTTAEAIPFNMGGHTSRPVISHPLASAGIGFPTRPQDSNPRPIGAEAAGMTAPQIIRRHPEQSEGSTLSFAPFGFAKAQSKHFFLKKEAKTSIHSDG